MNKYEKRIHIGCGGLLTYEKTIREHGIYKDMYRCDKCKALIQVITCSSWDDYQKIDNRYYIKRGK